MSVSDVSRMCDLVQPVNKRGDTGYDSEKNIKDFLPLVNAMCFCTFVPLYTNVQGTNIREIYCIYLSRNTANTDAANTRECFDVSVWRTFSYCLEASILLVYIESG